MIFFWWTPLKKIAQWQCVHLVIQRSSVRIQTILAIFGVKFALSSGISAIKLNAVRVSVQVFEVLFKLHAAHCDTYCVFYNSRKSLISIIKCSVDVILLLKIRKQEARLIIVKN